MKNIQFLIETFANIHATAKQDWPAERTEKLRLLGTRLLCTETVIKSLHPSVGNKIDKWHSADIDNNSIPYVVSSVLSGHGASVGDKYDDFLFLKAEELRRIQDELFRELSV